MQFFCQCTCLWVLYMFTFLQLKTETTRSSLRPKGSGMNIGWSMTWWPTAWSPKVVSCGPARTMMVMSNLTLWLKVSGLSAAWIVDLLNVMMLTWQSQPCGDCHTDAATGIFVLCLILSYVRLDISYTMNLMQHVEIFYLFLFLRSLLPLFLTGYSPWEQKVYIVPFGPTHPTLATAVIFSMGGN